MVANAASVSVTHQSSETNLITYCANKAFEQVASDLESQLGHLDQNAALSGAESLQDSVKRMEGASGLMIISVLEMDRLLPELARSNIRSRQYLIGNPLIADKMAKFNTLATLFAPPRVLLFTRDGQTCISYEKPSTTFGRLNSSEISKVAGELDEKFKELAIQALS
ncbi:MAG TPA: DUF302 domain-containing protein [Drouetiella sp.]|jgi:uncharacterized protein (DUF302 family)